LGNSLFSSEERLFRTSRVILGAKGNSGNRPKRIEATGSYRWAQLMKRLELIHVECYSGYKANEVPRAFIRKGKRYDIVEIRDRWYEGGISRRSVKLDYYRVLAGDGKEYILRYNSLFDKWALLLRSPGF